MKYIVIRDAGSDGANGVYKKTENEDDTMYVRNSSWGDVGRYSIIFSQTKYQWFIANDDQHLYLCENTNPTSLIPPRVGWKVAHGRPPAPVLLLNRSSMY
eukprot:CAMPEP_0202468234 /NCGR_PEP_ID=MMETSP1360-20130828/74652_1 /ASSEMBLY_ACC=CAM_ASM_000848 /TAXON_ID=515479 /ORGANISM="Licmophora paradoxa, Strain CCMP2313" /LENGTH=99 /DNA_ID=CAMNT_0049093091 /DNA_START=83 /DNA_END=382 /DNA_ORIENTATION=-